MTKRNNKRNDTGVQAALLLLRAYKLYVSPWFAGSCRFEPTCSLYASRAIERHGLARGVRLTLKRLARCQPLSGKFGYDPVPEIVATPDDVNASAEEKSRSLAALGMTNGGVGRGQEVPS